MEQEECRDQFLSGEANRIFHLVFPPTSKTSHPLLTVQVVVEFERDGQEVLPGPPLAQQSLAKVIRHLSRLGGRHGLPEDHMTPVTSHAPQIQGRENKLGEGLSDEGVWFSERGAWLTMHE